MRRIENEGLEKLPGKRLGPGDTFNFACKKELSCFNLCCRNLRLFLYPYDVLRLRKNLGITAGDFIDRHTDIVLREGSHFPEVLLRMADNEEQTCPFLTEAGCGVYLDRPYACRTFPTEHGIQFDDRGKPSGRVDLFRPPDFCLGQHESETWTVDAWLENQGALIYTRWMAEWSGFVRHFHQNPWGPEGPEGKAGRMAFMATYNLDAFREFVFGSSFLKRFRMPGAEKKKLKREDEPLLRLGMEWALFSIFGIPGKRIKK